MGEEVMWTAKEGQHEAKHKRERCDLDFRQVKWAFRFSYQRLVGGGGWGALPDER